jgi:hypothetical protein
LETSTCEVTGKASALSANPATAPSVISGGTVTNRYATANTTVGFAVPMECRSTTITHWPKVKAECALFVVTTLRRSTRTKVAKPSGYTLTIATPWGKYGDSCVSSATGKSPRLKATRTGYGEHLSTCSSLNQPRLSTQIPPNFWTTDRARPLFYARPRGEDLRALKAGESLNSLSCSYGAAPSTIRLALMRHSVSTRRPGGRTESRSFTFIQ